MLDRNCGKGPPGAKISWLVGRWFGPHRLEIGAARLEQKNAGHPLSVFAIFFTQNGDNCGSDQLSCQLRY
jgi:hypothetical protein